MHKSEEQTIYILILHHYSITNFCI